MEMNDKSEEKTDRQRRICFNSQMFLLNFTDRTRKSKQAENSTTLFVKNRE